MSRVMALVKIANDPVVYKAYVLSWLIDVLQKGSIGPLEAQHKMAGKIMSSHRKITSTGVIVSVATKSLTSGLSTTNTPRKSFLFPSSLIFIQTPSTAGQKGSPTKILQKNSRISFMQTDFARYFILTFHSITPSKARKIIALTACR